MVTYHSIGRSNGGTKARTRHGPVLRASGPPDSCPSAGKEVLVPIYIEHHLHVTLGRWDRVCGI